MSPNPTVMPAAAFLPPASRTRLGRGGPRRSTTGLTLIEILIGLVLVGIVLAQALPDSSAWVARYRVSGQIGTLSAAMAYAKTEAITRGVRVAVCTSSAPTAARPVCSSPGDWTEGWLVFVDNVQRAGNSPGVVDDDDTVLRVGQRLNGATANTPAALRDWVAFTPDGLSLASGGTSIGAIGLCLQHQGRTLNFGSTGLVSTTTGAC